MAFKNLSGNKVKIHPAIDEHLNEMIEQYCCCRKIHKQDFIAECIAKSLDIKLNEDFLIDDSEYAKHKIREIDETISILQDKRAEFEVNIL